MVATRRPGFVGRSIERDLLDGLLARVRAGASEALIIRGEAGIGKTALLRYAARQAAGFQVAQLTGVQAEMELPFAGVHQLCTAIPDRIEALIVQNAVAHNEGLGAIWKTRRAFWADRAANEGALRANLLSLATTRTRHVGSDPNVEGYAPDLWTDEFAFLSQPGQVDIQSDLFYDYRTNVDSYPKWQTWMRERQPRLLVIWGKYDPSFDISEPEAYRRDVPNAEVHIIDAGHFALDTRADEIAALVGQFMKRQK